MFCEMKLWVRTQMTNVGRGGGPRVGARSAEAALRPEGAVPQLVRYHLPCVHLPVPFESIHIHIYLSFHLPIYLSIYLSIYQSIHPSFYVCMYVCMYLSIYLYICIYIYIYTALRPEGAVPQLVRHHLPCVHLPSEYGSYKTVKARL